LKKKKKENGEGEKRKWWKKKENESAKPSGDEWGERERERDFEGGRGERGGKGGGDEEEEAPEAFTDEGSVAETVMSCAQV
jgi:hypothetical protein